MKKLILAVLAAASLAAGAAAQVVYFDNFDGNTAGTLSTGTFATGASTGFSYWAIGTPGDMDAGYFSVVNRAHDVHSQFSSMLDADNNPTGSYAAFNGYNDQDGTAYQFTVTGLNVGDTYDLGAMLLPLAPNPPYADASYIRFTADGSALGSDYTLVPVPSSQEQWMAMDRTFVAASSSATFSILNIGSPSGAGNDFGLDNVTLTDVQAVPEPCSMTALVIGGLALLRRKRKA